MSIKEQIFQQKNLWHLGALVVFLAITIGYFTPAFTGYTINQGDVTNWSGSAQEIMSYREKGEVVHWTNSMFSGMPGVQISNGNSGYAILNQIHNILTLYLPAPASYLFLYFMGFYILSLALKIKPKIAILGAVAYGLSSYFIVILQAGHNTKALAIGYAPLVLAGFIWSYRSKKMLFPLALSALFMAIEIKVNHLQITYYLGMVLVAVGIVEFTKAIKDKKIASFGKRTVGVLLMYALALGLNYSNIKSTLDYAKYTTRGGSELTINPDGTPKEKTGKQTGLDVEYITAWSYGKSETFSLIIPNFKGGATQAIGDNDANKNILKNVDGRFKQNIKGMNQYWGEQPFTSGPVYIGIIVVFMAFLALFYLDDNLKWALLAVTIFTILLSWGKNFLGFTEFFLEYLPGYNKFRAVTIILFVAELTIPLLAVLFLNKLIKKREEILKNILPFLIVSGVFVLLLLGFYLVPTSFNTFITNGELDMLASAPAEQLTGYQDLFDELEAVRISIFQKDVLRSLIFLILGGGTIFIALKNKEFAQKAMAPILIVLIIFDLLSIDTRFLGKSTKGNKAQWKQKWKQKYPVVAAAGDKKILEFEMVNSDVSSEINSAVELAKKDLRTNKIKGGEANRVIEQKQFRTLGMNTHFRVFEQGNPFNSSRASYFHKSIGGYHGAKLGIYQELIEFHLSKNNQPVLNMLNMKYILGYGGTTVTENANSLGNAWFVKNIKTVQNADESILSLTSKPTDEFEIESLNGFSLVVNGAINNKTVIKGTETMVLLSPNNDSIPLTGGLPLDDVKQQNLSLISTPQGLQWAPAGMGESILDIKNKKIGFTPENLAVMQVDYSNKLSSKEFTGEGSIVLNSYHPDKLTYTSSSSSNQLAVFSEVYIKDGWTATIDGEPADILRANYVLRAIEIPAGEHDVIMTYHVSSFDNIIFMSYSLSILILLLVGFAFYWDYVKTPQNKETVD